MEEERKDFRFLMLRSMISKAFFQIMSSSSAKKASSSGILSPLLSATILWCSVILAIRRVPRRSWHDDRNAATLSLKSWSDLANVPLKSADFISFQVSFFLSNPARNQRVEKRYSALIVSMRMCRLDLYTCSYGYCFPFPKAMCGMIDGASSWSRTSVRRTSGASPGSFSEKALHFGFEFTSPKKNTTK